MLLIILQRWDCLDKKCECHASINCNIVVIVDAIESVLQAWSQLSPLSSRSSQLTSPFFLSVLCAKPHQQFCSNFLRNLIHEQIMTNVMYNSWLSLGFNFTLSSFERSCNHTCCLCGSLKTQDQEIIKIRIKFRGPTSWFQGGPWTE